jgi:serine/threonine protein kinase
MEISRKYAVTEKVGQGGMGMVYKVRHITLDTTLALKVLPHELTDHAEMLTRFYREARLMARLKHPNIVQVLDIDRDEALNFHYFVMEFIHGKTLRQYIRDQGALPLAEVLYIAIQVAKALTYAHTQVPSVIHRDVKPSNIMIEDPSGRVVVMDFGIAKEIGQSDATRTGAIMGTMKYCAPEQMRHEPVDGAADIYALGMVIYEAYTGKQFFAGLDEATIVGKVLYEPQENIADFSPDTPPVFTAVVTKAIAKSRERRYQTARQLLLDLEQCRAALEAGAIEQLSLPGLEYASPPPAQTDLEDIEKRLLRLKGERDQRLATTLQQQVQQARERAATVAASQWAEMVWQQAATHEERGQSHFQSRDYQHAYEAYQEALPLFTQAYETAQTTAARKQEEQSRAAVETKHPEAQQLETREPVGTKDVRTPVLALPPLTNSEIDEDHWEIGEEKSTPLPLPRAKVTVPPRTSPVLAALFGFGVVAVLGIALWWTGFLSPTAKPPPVVIPVAPPNQPPQLLSFTPPTDAVELVDGTTQAFQIEASDPEGEPLVYAWTLDGAAAGAQPVFDWKAQGAGSHLLRAVVTDGKGLSATHEWQVAVLSPPPPQPPEPEKPQVVENAPPQITHADPDSSVIVTPEGATLTFSTTASDPNGDNLTYEWSIDEKKVSRSRASTSPTFSWKAQGTGNHQVRALVGDSGGLTVSKEWQVAVLVPPEPPTPPVPSEPPPPPTKNAPPEIIVRVPDEKNVKMVEGATITLSATAIDPDGEELLYEWLLNGKKVASDATFPFTAERLGTRRVEVKVTDPRGGKVSVHWDIQIEARPPTPQLVMFTPHENHYALYDHLSRFFGVEVEVPGVPEPELRYEWKINGKSVEGHELLEFKNQPIGTHRVEVAVLSAAGERVTHQWTVQVRPDEADRPSIWAPLLEIVELNNTLSKDKKVVTVTGTLRNTDEERTADNVIVWVSAINAQEEAVARRMTLPSPQPLAPGQVASFRVQFANHDAMSDFRVEVLSK